MNQGITNEEFKEFEELMTKANSIQFFAMQRRINNEIERRYESLKTSLNKMGE